MKNYKTFIEKEPSAIATVVSRKGNLCYEVLLISYFENDSNEHQKLLFNFFNSCTAAMSNNTKMKSLTNKDVTALYSEKDPSAITTVCDKENNPLYKMILVSHAKNDKAYEGHLNRFAESCFVIEKLMHIDEI